MILSLPWLVVSVVVYNLIAFSTSWPADAGSATRNVFDQQLFTITMISNAKWSLTLGDVMILVTLVLLFVELVKATRTGGNSIVDHALSTILFIVCLIEFIIVPRAATSVFFIITAVALIDVVAGFSITIRAARRDLTVGGGGI